MVELQVQFRGRSLAGDAFESGAYGQTATHRQIATFFWTFSLISYVLFQIQSLQSYSEVFLTLWQLRGF